MTATVARSPVSESWRVTWPELSRVELLVCLFVCRWMLLLLLPDSLECVSFYHQGRKYSSNNSNNGGPATTASHSYGIKRMCHRRSSSICLLCAVVGGVYAMWPTFCQSVCVNKVVGRLFVCCLFASLFIVTSTHQPRAGLLSVYRRHFLF